MNSFWKNTIIYAFGFLFLRAISFFLLPLYTNLLTPFDAGVVFLIYTLLAFLNPVYAYGMNASFFKFYNNKLFSKYEIFSTSFVSLLITSLLFSGILILFSKPLNLLIVSSHDLSINWFLYVSFILFFDSFSSRAFVVLRLNERPVYFLFAGLINIVFSLWFNLLFIGSFGWGGAGAVLSLLLVSIIQFLFLAPSYVRLISFKNFSVKLLKEMLAFAVPFLPSALLFVIIGFSDRWFIKYFLDLQSVGIYGSGYKLGSLISLIVTAFNLNWQPYYLKQNIDSKNNFGLIGGFFILFLFYVFIILLLFVDKLVMLELFGYHIIGEEFWACLTVVPFVAMGYVFYGVYVLQTPSIFLLNKQNWGLVFWFSGALTNVIGNIVLIPVFGIVGAALSTLLAYFLMMVFIIYKNASWFPVFYPAKQIFLFVFLGILILGLKFIINDVSTFSLFLLSLVYSFVLFLCCLKIRNINFNEYAK